MEIAPIQDATSHPSRISFMYKVGDGLSNFELEYGFSTAENALFPSQVVERGIRIRKKVKEDLESDDSNSKDNEYLLLFLVPLTPYPKGDILCTP